MTLESRQHLAAGIRAGGWTQLATFRWRDLAVGAAARSAVGVIVPLLVGLWCQRVSYGVFAALGALPAGMASFQGISRSRISAIAMATGGAAVSTFVGATVGAHDAWLFVPVTALWCYVIGLFSALGPRVTIATLQWPVALMIASALPLDAQDALLRSAFVLAGGALQGVLVAGSWTLSRGTRELEALAQVYDGLADHVRAIDHGDRAIPTALPLPGADALRDPNPLLRTTHRMVLLGLLTQAERMRTTVTAIGRSGHPALLDESSEVFSAVAVALRARRSQRPAELRAVGALIASTCAGGDERRSWASESLLGQLRATASLLEELGEGTGSMDRLPRIVHAPGPRQAELSTLWLTLRAARSLRTESGRHAVRLAAVATVAETIALASGVDHGYWITIAAVLVLRPDYTATFERGLQRAVGTSLGAGIGALTILALPDGHASVVGGAAVAIAICYSLVGVNYLLFTTFLTTFVVDLLSLLGRSADSTAVTRIGDTAAGATLALVGYVLWPTWEGTAASDKIAHLVRAQGRYADALLQAHATPGPADDARLRTLQLAARRDRSEAEISLDRLSHEPAHPPMTTDLAEDLIGSAQRKAQVLLGLHAALRHRDARSIVVERSPEELTALGDLIVALEDASDDLVMALEQLRPPAPTTRLRELQLAFAALSADETLTAGTDALVDAHNGGRDALDRRLQDSVPTGR